MGSQLMWNICSWKSRQVLGCCVQNYRIAQTRISVRELTKRHHNTCAVLPQRWENVSFGCRLGWLDCLTWNWRHWWNLGVTRGSGWEFRTPIPPTPSNNSTATPSFNPHAEESGFTAQLQKMPRQALHSLCWGSWLGYAALTWACIKFLKVGPFVYILFSLETVNQYTI